MMVSLLGSHITSISHNHIDLTGVVGNDVGLMIRGFAAALEDDNILVRRGTLELLCTTLRMDGVVMKK